MWIINWLPEFFIHLILVIGIVGTIAGFVLGFIPFINKYKLPIQIISILVLSFGIYLQGGLSEKKKWEIKVKDLEIKVRDAEAKSNKVNTEIVEKLITKKEYIKIRGDKVIEYIDREVKVDDNVCKIPPEVVKAYNMSITETETPK